MAVGLGGPGRRTPAGAFSAAPRNKCQPLGEHSCVPRFPSPARSSSDLPFCLPSSIYRRGLPLEDCPFSSTNVHSLRVHGYLCARASVKACIKLEGYMHPSTRTLKKGALRYGQRTFGHTCKKKQFTNTYVSASGLHHDSVRRKLANNYCYGNIVIGNEEVDTSKKF